MRFALIIILLLQNVIASSQDHLATIDSKSNASPKSTFHLEFGYNANFNGRAGGGFSIEPKLLMDRTELGLEFSTRKFQRILDNTNLYDKDKARAIMASAKYRFNDRVVTPYMGVRMGVYHVKLGNLKDPFTTAEPNTYTSFALNINAGFYIGPLNIGLALSEFKPYDTTYSLNLGFRY